MSLFGFLTALLLGTSGGLKIRSGRRFGLAVSPMSVVEVVAGAGLAALSVGTAAGAGAPPRWAIPAGVVLVLLSSTEHALRLRAERLKRADSEGGETRGVREVSFCPKGYALTGSGMLQDLGNIGEFIGALGVVISLVYLARQMIQNTDSVRAASFNSMVQNSIRLTEHTFRDPEFAAFLICAQDDPAGLSREDRLRWDSYMTAVYRHFGNLQYSHRVGTLDHQMWRAYHATLKEHLRTPAWAQWFQDNRHMFSTALGEQVDVALGELESETAVGELTEPGAAVGELTEAEAVDDTLVEASASRS